MLVDWASPCLDSIADRTAPPAPDPVGRDSGASAPDVRWCGDTAYVPVGSDRMYFAPVIDMHFRRVVGWLLAERMRSDLFTDATEAAARPAAATLIIHGDRGSQDASAARPAGRTRLRRAGHRRADPARHRTVRRGQLLSDPALYAVLVGGIGGMYLHTVALQIGSVNGATAALVVRETVVPGAVGVLSLGDTARAGLGWLAVLGFLLTVAGAVAVARFGEPAPAPAADPPPPEPPEAPDPPCAPTTIPSKPQAYVPALHLPVWGGLTQLFIAFALAQLILGWKRALLVAYVSTLAGTLSARFMIWLGPDHVLGPGGGHRASPVR